MEDRENVVKSMHYKTAFYARERGLCRMEYL